MISYAETKNDIYDKNKYYSINDLFCLCMMTFNF